MGKKITKYAEPTENTNETTPTMNVKVKGGNGDVVRINVADYDKKVHTMQKGEGDDAADEPEEADEGDDAKAGKNSKPIPPKPGTPVGGPLPR